MHLVQIVNVVVEICMRDTMHPTIPNTTKGCARLYLNKMWLIAHQNLQYDVGDMLTLVKIPFLPVVTGRKIYPSNLLFKVNDSSLKGTVQSNMAYRTFCFTATYVTIN